MVKMFPSKSMVEYMSEMSRLFARPSDEILQQHPYYMSSQSPIYTMTNQSSSSTDSTSPESFPEVTMFQNPYTTQPNLYEAQTPIFESPRQSFDTPKGSNTPNLAKRQRPIVGRKIFGPEASTPNIRPQTSPTKIPEGFTPVWQDDVLFQPSPPTMEQYNRNMYELFPPESRFEVRTPVKTSPTVSNVSAVSPSHSLSPKSVSQSPVGPLVVYKRPPTPNPNMWPSTYRPNEMGPSKMCTFCRKNGETPIVYLTHRVKERGDNDRYIATCPILRSHVCSVCGASGDDAHTITYCPVLRSGNNGQPLRSTTITLKNTRIKSNGRRRF